MPQRASPCGRKPDFVNNWALISGVLLFCETCNFFYFIEYKLNFSFDALYLTGYVQIDFRYCSIKDT